jgi:poly(3-hydroxyoctanoate) depolymerase
VWGSEHVVEVDENPLRVVRVGTGAPLLLINGIGASAEMWTPLVSRLDGHELVAVDLPGTGSSPHAPRPLRIRGLARLIEHLLDALGCDTIDVLGYSFGGIVAQELALQAPRRVERLVLCATSPGLGGVPPSPLAAMLMLSPARLIARRMATMMPRASLSVVRGGGHLFLLDEPESVVGELARFLARNPS